MLHTLRQLEALQAGLVKSFAQLHEAHGVGTLKVIAGIQRKVAQIKLEEGEERLFEEVPLLVVFELQMLMNVFKVGVPSRAELEVRAVGAAGFVDVHELNPRVIPHIFRHRVPHLIPFFHPMAVGGIVACWV